LKKELVSHIIISELGKLNPETDKELLESIHKILAKNTDPKLVQGVTYEVIKAKVDEIKKVTHDIDKLRI